ncbi:MAG: hypothetical protein ABFC96_00750 [Thermoguttaceae bacterium]
MNPDDRPTIEPAVRSLLARLRRRIRRYVWIEGCAAAVAWLGLSFWATLAVDWLFEPAVVVRLLMLAAVIVVLVAVLVRRIFRRAFVPITDSNAAMLLERRFPQLQDTLLTAVVLGDPRPVPSLVSANMGLSPSAAPSNAATLAAEAGQDALSVEMLTRTCHEAAARTNQVELGKVFNRRPLWLHGGAAILLVASIAIFALLENEAFATWARRTLTLSNQLWPRKTHFVCVEGFSNGVRKVARGSDVEIIARADTDWPRVPKTAEIRYRMEGARGRATMDRRGIVGNHYQQYAYVFHNVPADIHFDIVGGDDRISDLRIQAVDSPTIGTMVLRCEPPAYTRRKASPLAVTGVMQIPMGSRVTVVAGPSNKRLIRVQVTSTVGEQPATVKTLEQSQLTSDHRGFLYRLGAVMKDTTLLFGLTDCDQITPPEPVRLALSPTPDQPPQMTVLLDGIGTAITPKARVAVAGRITDDYGIARVWFEHALGEKKSGNQTLAKLPGAPALFTLPPDAALEVRDLGVKPGQKLTVSLRAADFCDLGAGPNVAATERWVLDVVTPQQLRAMLESRELVLRQRFEAMIQEMTETRDLLARLDFQINDGHEKAKPVSRGPGASVPSGPSGTTKKLAEPGDEEPDDSPARKRTLRLLGVEGTVSNCRKSTQEVLGLAEAFEDICKQLINNRIDTEELRKRLQGGIAQPLRRVSEQMLPELERRLEALTPALDDARQGPLLRDHAQQQADEILVVMRGVLGRMIELETYNEAVKMLQEIIDKQEKLQKEIDQRHKQKIRELLKGTGS